jgi:hypothetical protein
VRGAAVKEIFISQKDRMEVGWRRGKVFVLLIAEVRDSVAMDLWFSGVSDSVLRHWI